MGLNNTLTNEDEDDEGVENLRTVNLYRLEKIVRATGQNNIKSPRHTLSNSIYNLPLTGAPLTAPGAPQKLRASLSRLPGSIRRGLNTKPRKTRKARKARKTRRRESR
jgi:hypothetical protein